MPLDSSFATTRLVTGRRSSAGLLVVRVVSKKGRDEASREAWSGPGVRGTSLSGSSRSQEKQWARGVSPLAPLTCSGSVTHPWAAQAALPRARSRPVGSSGSDSARPDGLAREAYDSCHRMQPPAAGCEPDTPGGYYMGVPRDVVHPFALVRAGIEGIRGRGVPRSIFHVVHLFALVALGLDTPCTTCTTK